MKILSIDTASNICGVSILEDTQLICKLDQDFGRTHSENLMPMISQSLEQCNFTLQDIDLLVYDKGPGSFTGIRIGIATIKAFHDSLSIPCIGISSLESLAYGIKKDGFIACILDCKNDNCYFALYHLNNGKYTQVVAPIATTIEDSLTICQQSISIFSPITFVGDGSLLFKELILQKFDNYLLTIEQNAYLDSYCLGLAGLVKWEENKSEEDILPLYLKKPQAQRQLEEKSKKVEIVPMTNTDLDSISSILTSDFDDFWNETILKNELNAENSTYLVAKLEEQIVGFAGIKILVDEANIMNIVVKKDFRNQGIGSLLLQDLINLSKEKNATSILLEVMEENYPAIHLYKNFGFKQIGMRKNYYQNKNAIIMRWV